MSNCNSCASKGSCGKTESTCGVVLNDNNRNIKKVYAVMSGKGGVGKSSMTVLLAKQMIKKGYKVGILDADITGPSIPRLLGLEAESAMGEEKGILPIVSSEGIKMISVNSMISNENAPVLWKGAMLTKILNQFWTDVQWGELDVLFVDLPPGTGDVAMTVLQNMAITSAIMVTIPQDMISMIVGKAMNMCSQLEISVLGIIENMAYVQCPGCDEKIYLYENTENISLVEQFNVEKLVEIPMMKQVANINRDHTFTLEEQLVVDRYLEPILSIM